MKQIRETSDFVCEKLISKVPITDFSMILEPSIGEGKIIKFLLENYSFNKLHITGIELNKERYNKCLNNLYSFKKDNWFEFYQCDFLNYNTKDLFDIIIACPPFKGNIDLLHIQKMFVHLKHKGIMTTLTSPYWLTNNEPIQIEFRKWLEDKNYQLELLPDNTFIEKDKNQPTAILTIYKRNK